MLLVVTGVGFIIHIYSIGYMHAEDGYYRFFSYLNLFLFSMLVLVLAGNFLLMFIGWEGVGLCSYLLIGYYFDRKSAGDAGKKAFIVNRIGDVGFILGMFLVFATFGSLDFGEVFRQVASAPVRFPVETGFGLLTAISLLLFVGATGKSAQIPLYVWLPDAMEGPTPVSALIHAATMVTAGVYMVVRCSPIFSRSEIALAVVSVVGILTAWFAATIGLTQTDIKRVLAYSTISQLGYMFVGGGSHGLLRGHLSSDDARILQGAALPRSRKRHPCHGRRAGPHADGRPAEIRPDDVSHHADRRPRNQRHLPLRRLLQQGRDSLVGLGQRPSGRLARGARSRLG